MARKAMQAAQWLVCMAGAILARTRAGVTCRLEGRVALEEILKRFPVIEVVGEPKRVYSSFVKGYERMNVVIPKRA